DYSLIIYSKGAWALHMLRNYFLDLKTMKDDVFLNIMKDFYQTYYLKNASTNDFIETIKKVTNQDMTWFFDEWVNSSYIPKYTYTFMSVPTQDGKFTLKMKVKQENV